MTVVQMSVKTVVHFVVQFVLSFVAGQTEFGMMMMISSLSRRNPLVVEVWGEEGVV
jgi:hypothetical protein